VAHEFAEWVDSQARPSTTIGRIFEKVRDTLSAIGDVFRRNGFDSAEKIFHGIERGAVGRRSDGTVKSTYTERMRGERRRLRHSSEIEKGPGVKTEASLGRSPLQDHPGPPGPETRIAKILRGVKYDDGTAVFGEEKGKESDNETPQFARRQTESEKRGDDLFRRMAIDPPRSTVDYLSDKSISLTNRLKGDFSLEAMHGGFNRWR
jgi:hypothetical protein